MVSISILIDDLHPAIVASLVEAKRDVTVIQKAVNDLLSEHTATAVETGVVKSKEGKGQVVKITASGKLSGINLPNTPAALLARVHWYLSGSREIYTRVESVTLPKSVLDWVGGKQFDTAEQKEAEAKVEAEAKEAIKA
jgi:hypothetical protein